MSNVLQLRREEKKERTAAGEAFCVACGHEHVAVAPEGVEFFECPACHTHKARFKFPFAFSQGQLVRECNCGNQLFYLSPEGHLCANCGIYQEY